MNETVMTEYPYHEDVLTKIKTLAYTSSETQAVYLERLSQCKQPADYHELIAVIDAGEAQLRQIQRNYFQQVETCVLKINDCRHLTLTEKRHWIERLIACDFVEDVMAVYEEAMTGKDEVRG